MEDTCPVLTFQRNYVISDKPSFPIINGPIKFPPKKKKKSSSLDVVLFSLFEQNANYTDNH